MTTTGNTAVLEFLGTGTSTGIPIPGCDCPVCRSTDPHDNRWRSSVLITYGQYTVVIDTGPEFRLQCLRARVTHLDAVLLTHSHADHLNGLDDVRAYSLFKKKTLPVWGSPATLADLRHRFGYIWKPLQKGGGVPDIVLKTADGPFAIGELPIIPIPIRHGLLDILGFRIGNLAYMTDISTLPDASLPLLHGLDTMIISCVRGRNHRTHLGTAGVKRLHKLIRPRQTLLTHLAHYLSHRDLIAEMPVDISPAYDGLRVEFTP